MNLRYASVILLLSSAMIGGWLLIRPAPSVTQDTRLLIVVPVPPLKAALDAFVDQKQVRVASLMDGHEDVHHMHLNPKQLRLLERADVTLPWGEEADPHQWLSLIGIDAVLLQISPVLDKVSIRRKAVFFSEYLKWLRRQQDRFADVANAPFIVDHDAFQGFESDMGLSGKLGALTSGHDQAIGAKSLRDLRAKAAGKNVCVLHGPHANTNRLATMLEGATLHFTEADPLLWNDPSYASGMQRLADAFYECLSKAQSAEATP